MSKLFPIASSSNQNPSKENQNSSIIAVDADEDEFEDSLNQSISEHISEEIESNNNVSSVEDSIENPKNFNQLALDKRRKLFDIDGDNDVGHSDFTFGKFNINNDNLDTLLSGEQIAQHFKVDDVNDTIDTRLNRNAAMNLSASSKVESLSSKIDVEQLSDDGAVATGNQSLDNVQSEHKVSKELEDSDGVEVTDVEKEDEQEIDENEPDDVILINDHEISIHSLKRLQHQQLVSETEPSPIENTNQNTTSDISDLLNEDNVSSSKEHQSSIKSTNISETEITKSASEKSKIVNSSELTVDEKQSNSVGSNTLRGSGKNAVNSNDVSLQKTDPVLSENKSKSSIVVLETNDQSMNNKIENDAEKQSEMKKIVNETVDKLPLDRRPTNLRDELLMVEMGHKRVDSATTDGNATDSEQRFSSIVTEINTSNVAQDNVFSAPIANQLTDPLFQSELNVNLTHMQNKIKELQNISAGKYSINSVLNLPLDIPGPTSSRRNSLKDSLKDLPQSGRDSTSITTNSTEYKTFQDEYLRVSI